MAISRVEGPMLLSSLDRQGVDLSFVTNPGSGTQTLMYMDFTNFRLGVNTTTTTERLTVEGNISVNAYIKTSFTNQHMYLLPNGTGQVIVSNVNIQRGNINATDIGTTTTANAAFTNANVTTKLTAGVVQPTNLTAGRVAFSNGSGLTDSASLLFFTSNNTLFATSIESAGTVGYTNLSISGQFIYNPGTFNYVPFFASNHMMIVDSGMQYFVSNSTFRANTVQLAGQVSGRVLYTVANNAAVGSGGLTYDGLNLTATGITTLGAMTFSGQTISGVGLDQDLVLSPVGLGTVSLQTHRISNLGTPLVPTDAATKSYVDGLVKGTGANVISQNTSFVSVQDDGFGGASAIVSLYGTTTATFTPGFSTFGDWRLNDNYLITTAGDATIIPATVGLYQDRVRLQTTSSAVVPVGTTDQRPAIPEVGDFRFNNDIGTLEWYTGTAWNSASQANTTAVQLIQTPVIDGITKTFTLNQAADTASVLIIVNGTVQQATVTYTVTGNILTFSEAPLASDVVEVRFLAASIVYAANPIFINTGFTGVSAAGATVDSFYCTQYRTVVYDFTSKNTVTGVFQAGQVYLTHSYGQGSPGANAVATLKTTIGSVVPLVNWSASIDGSGVCYLSGTDPVSSPTADRLTSTNSDGYAIQAVTNAAGSAWGTSAGQTYTFSVYLRSDSTATTSIAIGVVLSTANLSLTTAGYTAGTYLNTVVPLTQNWTRYSYTFTPSTNANAAVVIGGASTFNTGATVLAWGAQVNTGSSAGTYSATTTAPTVNNLLQYSEQIGTNRISGAFTVGWKIPLASATANVEPSPIQGTVFTKFSRTYFSDN